MRAGLIFAVALMAWPAMAMDPTGISECDKLINAYEACSARLPRERVHAAQIEIVESQQNFSAGARDAHLRPLMAQFCKTRLNDMKIKGDLTACMIEQAGPADPAPATR
ncbi:MAG: hypothetical protein KGL46_12605 [Hyphomicrobiales bacterium]|nr:hypothetical protein [Hyphomicrobiales bacterium]